MRRLLSLIIGLIALSSVQAINRNPTLRLYVFDCGTIRLADLSRLSVTIEETGTSDISVACYLIVHPKGTLMWDVGAIADAAWHATGTRSMQTIVLPDGQRREIMISRPLSAQLREAGFSEGNIDFLALSHYHYDHTANANDFTRSTWLVRKEERDPMFAPAPPGTTQPSTYAGLKTAKTVIIDTPEFDVFGDGSVIILSAPGHTPGHQVLALNLHHTGRVVISGDLYHFPVERQLERIPTIEFDPAETRASRIAIEKFIRLRGAHLWIQHDVIGDAGLKKAPSYYD